MIMFPMPINTSSGGMSNRAVLALLIAMNILLVADFFVMFYLFKHANYPGSFWQWSWDSDYFLKDNKAHTDLASVAFWIPLFVVDGIAFLVSLTFIIEAMLSNDD